MIIEVNCSVLMVGLELGWFMLLFNGGVVYLFLILFDGIEFGKVFM